MRLEPNGIVSQHDFIRLLAKKAQFTVGDTEIFWNSAEELIKELVENQLEIRLGIGRIYYLASTERDMINPRTLKKIHVHGARRVVFRLNSAIRNIIRNDIDKKPWKKTFEEVNPLDLDYGDLYDIDEEK